MDGARLSAPGTCGTSGDDGTCGLARCRIRMRASLPESGDRWAAPQYLRIVHLAATTMETVVAEALEGLLAEGATPTFSEAVRERVVLPGPAKNPALDIAVAELTVHDRLVARADAQMTP